MKNPLKHLVLLTTLLLSCFCLSALAQETTATINGQVTDSAGAVVSGAEITLTNLATKEARTVKSNDEGYYALTFIRPGLYDLSIKLSGFKEYINKGLELLVNDRKTINVALAAGQVSESVTVAPTGECLMALSSRLRSTRPSRSASPLNGESSSGSRSICTPRSCASARTARADSSTTSSR